MTRPTQWDLRLLASDELVAVIAVVDSPAVLRRSGTNASGGRTGRSRSRSLVGEGSPKAVMASGQQLSSWGQESITTLVFGMKEGSGSSEGVGEERPESSSWLGVIDTGVRG